MQVDVLPTTKRYAPPAAHGVIYPPATCQCVSIRTRIHSRNFTITFLSPQRGPLTSTARTALDKMCIHLFEASDNCKEPTRLLPYIKPCDKEADRLKSGDVRGWSDGEYAPGFGVSAEGLYIPRKARKGV